MVLFLSISLFVSVIARLNYRRLTKMVTDLVYIETLYIPGNLFWESISYINKSYVIRVNFAVGTRRLLSDI